jgi:hypothetical protein
MSATVAIRTNLLQDRDDTVKVFGRYVHESAIKDSVVALAGVLGLLLLIVCVQSFRYFAIEANTRAVSGEDATLSSQVAQSRRLADEVRALTSVISALQMVRTSGSDHAVLVATIGNSVRADTHTWLTNMTPANSAGNTNPLSAGWSLKGQSRSLYDLSVSLKSVAMRGSVSLQSLTAPVGSQGGAINYEASLILPTPAPSAPAAIAPGPGR